MLIGANGQARRFAKLAATVAPTGITFDSTGHFGHRLLVTTRSSAGRGVLAIDCAGRIHVVTGHAPRSRAASRSRRGDLLVRQRSKRPDHRSCVSLILALCGTLPLARR